MFNKLWAELSPDQDVQQKAGIPTALARLCSMSDITNDSVYSVTQRCSISLWVMLVSSSLFIRYWRIAAYKARSFGIWVLEVAELEMHGLCIYLIFPKRWFIMSNGLIYFLFQMNSLWASDNEEFIKKQPELNTLLFRYLSLCLTQRTANPNGQVKLKI